MNSKQNTNRQKQNKNVSKTIFTARSERSDVEIQKHFKSSKSNRDEINKGVDSFPIVGDVEFESNVEISLNIDKPNKITKKSFVVNNPTEISLDVVLPNELDANFEFYDNNNDFNTCTSLNKKVEDINKQLADLEKDIQFNFYDPKTKVGSNLKKYSSHLPSFSSSKNPSNTTITSTASDFGNVNKFNNAPKESDATIELKNEIYSYRNSLKQKQFEENIEKRLTQLHKQKEQSELRKNETKVELGHEPTCPLSLKIDLPEPVLKIHEMQLTAKRLKFADGDGALNSPKTQNASSSQTPRKTDQKTIQDKEQKQDEEPKPSTSKSNDTQIKTSLNNENDLPVSISDVEVGAVQQLNSLLEKSTNELDELKSLLKKYLETEKNNKSPRSEKNVKFSLGANTNTRKKNKPSFYSSSNSDVSIASQNIENRKKLPKEPPKTRPTMGVEKKTKVIKIKQISKSTKSTKCGLSDISESNELERNSSSSDVFNSGAAAPVKKQNNKKENRECEPTVTSDKQTEFMLNIVAKSSSSLLSSDEDKLTHIRDFIQKSPKDSNDLTNPPNTDRLPPPPLEKKSIDKTKFLEVQLLPPLEIKRSLTTQKLPAVAIESIESFVDPNKMSSENVKYIQITHGTDDDLPKEQTTTTAKSPDKVKDNTDNTKICTNICNTQDVCQMNSKTTEIKIEEIYIAQQQLQSSCDDIITEKPAVANNEKPKDVPKQRGSVSEELNLDIDSLPSVRTLKEIQNYLEQKCALIRSRLEEESKLKPSETLSLRYKLSEPPLWQSSNPTSGSKAEPENKNTIPPEQTPKPITLSPLKTYSSIKSPLSPLQKHDKSQQINSRLVCKPNPKLVKNPVKTVDKSLQVSISEDTELPIVRRENEVVSSQLSVQTSNKDIYETQEGFNTPPLTFPKTVNRNENSDSIREITVSPQKDNFKVVCIPCKDAVISISSSESLKETNNSQLVSHENQITNKALTDNVNKFSNISTQVDEFDYIEYPTKHVSFETVVKQYSFIPNENKETQISQSDLPEDITTKTPRDEKKKEKVVKKQCKNEKTQTTKNETPIVFCMQSNATQTINVKDKLTVCNIPGIVEKQEELQTKPSSIIKETKECCTQYSPVLEQQDLDATEYKKINSFRKIDTSESEEQNKRVHYQPVECRNYYKSTMRNKRPLQRHKICSTPVSPSSISTTTETISLSDGEMKLSCECSTSIGEIHLCRFANNIRKKVKILKQNPEEILKESFGRASSFKMTRQHKYNDNWFAYYVTKTESSSEHGTGSNLSSIKSNIETE